MLCPLLRTQDWFLVIKLIVPCTEQKPESKIVEIQLTDPRLTTVYF